MNKKLYYTITIIILLVLGTIVFINATSKDQYFKDVDKAVEYVNSTEKQRIIISLFEVERSVGISTNLISTISPTDEPEDFNLGIDLLNYVRNYPYTKSQPESNFDTKIYLLNFAVQIDKGKKSNLHNLPVYFNGKFDYFAVPANYKNDNVIDDSALRFYPISDVNYQNIAKKLFKQ